MNLNVDSFEELEILLPKLVTVAMETSVSKMAIERQMRAKWLRFYMAYAPKEYRRTYGFLRSNETRMLKPTKKKVKMVVYTDTRIRAMGGKHESWLDGTTQNKSIPYFAERGNQSSLFAYSKRPYIDYATQLIDRDIEKAMIVGLRKQGVDAK